MDGHVFSEPNGYQVRWTDRHCAYNVAQHVLDEVRSTLLDYVGWARSYDPGLAHHFLELEAMVSGWLRSTRLPDKGANRAITAEWNRLWDDEAALFRKLEEMLSQEIEPSAGAWNARRASHNHGCAVRGRVSGRFV
jgi:hypothetical protein